jgi:hypothetical protein
MIGQVMIREIKKKDVQERGMVLVVALFIMSVLIVLGGIAITNTTSDLGFAARYRFGLQALNDAEAGVQFTVAKIQQNVLCLPVNTGETVTITNTVPAGFSFDGSVNIVKTSANRYRFRQVGHSFLNITRRIEVVVKRRSALPYGAFGNSDVDLNPNSSIYSYDSRLTPNPNPANFPAASTHQADVASNTSVTAYNNTYVDGTVALGSDDASFTKTSSVTVTGTPGLIVDPVDHDPLGAVAGALAAQFAAYSGANDNALAIPVIATNTINTNGTVTLNGKLGGANYYLTSLTLRNGANMNINAAAGPVNIYLTGSLDAQTGSTINTTGLPTALSIFCNAATSIILRNGNVFKGLIYAPYASIELKNGADAFGLLWGNTLDLKNSVLFFKDSAIQDKFLSNRMCQVAWRDVRE